jgi:arginine decarboxylase
VQSGDRVQHFSARLQTHADQTQYGYLSEHHPYGETDEKAGEYAEDLAATMLATTLGVEFDPSVAWDEREKIYKMSGKIVKTYNVTQSAEGHKDGIWTTVVACAILLP